MTLATILEHAAVRQGELVLAPALTEPSGQPGERSRPPLDADATCHAVTGPKIPAVPNRAVTAAVAAPTAASTSRHGEPSAFGTAWSTPANRATSTKSTRTAANRERHRRNQPRTVPAGTPQPHRDPAVTTAGRPRRQRRADHLHGVRPPQQHRHRQQHMRDQTPTAPGPPRPQRADPTNATPPGPPPRRQHTRTTRTTHLTGRQP
jgi:hypothetical protein